MCLGEVVDVSSRAKSCSRQKGNHAGRALILAALCVAGFSHGARAATINVGPGQTYTTIQAGIDAAANGDTVLVAPGTYNENIDFMGKAITVTSSGGAAATIIDGGSNGPAVTFKSGETAAAVISGFTIQHGGELGWVTTIGDYGIGNIYVLNSSPTILNNTITLGNCWGIETSWSAATIENNTISQTQDPDGDCSFGGGAAIIVWGGINGYNANGINSGVILGNTIENNVESGLEDAGGNGGAGIAVWGGAPLIKNNIIRNNASPGGSGGAINFVNSRGTVIAQNLIYGNSAGCGGGAIATDGDGLYVFNNTIVDNVGAADAGFSECASIAQIYPSPDTYGTDNPSEVFINNIIAGSTSYPAVNCSWFEAPSLSTQPTFENNILYNAGGPFFGSYCIDVSQQDNNIAADPQFVNQSENNYHLQSTSPAIDSGQNSVLQTFMTQTGTTWTTDFDGNPRVQNATGKGCIIDMGAYEVHGALSNCGVSETLTSSLNPATAGQNVTFTAQLSSTTGTPTGEVQFLDGANLLSMQTVSGTGSAAFTTNSLTVGSHTITANYQPTGTFGADTASLIEVINGFTTGTSLTSSLNPATVGQSVSFTATLTSSQGSPTGSVIFADGATTLGTVALVNGVAALTTSTLTVGSHPITATYSPNGSFAGSSATLTEVINGAATSTNLTSTLNSAYALESVTLNAAVSSTVTGNLTGSVTFMDGAASLGTVQSAANGTASLTVNFQAPGSHLLTAVYSGNASFNSSTSNVLTETVLINTTTTVLQVQPVTAGAFTPVTLNVAVASPSAAQFGSLAGPTGVVTLYDGGVLFATLTLSPTDTASASLSSFQAGTHILTAVYGGNTSFAGSTSAQATLIVTPDATTTTLSGAPNPAALGTAVTFNMTVASAVTPFPPTGTVTVYDGANALGQATLKVPGQASFSTSALTAGTHSITASYSGDANFIASTSSPFQETISPFLGDFTFTVAPSSITLYTGQAGSAKATAVAQDGFNYTLALSCTGLPAGATCAFQPSTIANGAGTSALVIQTSAPEAVSSLEPGLFHGFKRSGAAGVLACVVFLFLPRRRRHWWLIAVLALWAASAVTACGGPGTLTGGTPPGTYTITVTAEATNSGQQLAHSSTVTLTVKSLF